MIDTYSQEWRRITEALWVLRDCKDRASYMKGVLEKRGKKGHDMLRNDVALVRPHIGHFTKRIAAGLIEKMD
jgi:hypothetical protein